MSALKSTTRIVAVAVLVAATAAAATEQVSTTANAFQPRVAATERSLLEIGRYVTELCRSARLGSATELSDLRTRCRNLVDAADSGTAEDVARAIVGLKRMNSEEATSLQNTTLHVRSALAGFRGRGDTASSIAVSGNYNVPGAFNWSSGAAGDAASPWEVFVNGIYNTSDKDATPLAMGFESDDVGVSGGMSYNVSDAFVVGVTLGYLASDSTLDGDSGTLDAEGIDYGVFASFYPTERLYFDGMITLNATDHDLLRNVSYIEPALFAGSTVDQKMLASMESDRLDMSATLGTRFLKYSGDSAQFETDVYARADYSDVKIGGYTETASAPGSLGAGLALAIDGQRFNSLTATAGFSVNGQWGSGDRPWYPYAMAEYTHEFETNDDPISGRFAMDPDTGARFRLPIDQGDRNYFSLGAGTSVALTDRLYGFFRYQGLVGYRGLTVHAFQVGLRQTF